MALQNEKRYRLLFENMSEGGSVYRPVDGGEDFILVDRNCKAEQLDTNDHKNFIGRRLSELCQEKEDVLLLNVIQRVYGTGTPEHYPFYQYQDQLLENWRDNFVFRLDSGEVVILYDDVTEKKQLEHTLQQTSHELSLQNSIITQFLTTDDDTAYQHILRSICQALHSSFGFLGYLNAKEELVCTLFHTEPQEQYKMVRREIIAPSNLSHSLLEKALHNGNSIIENSQGIFPVDNQSFNNLLVVPVQYQDQVLGLICVANRDDDYSNEDMRLLENICSSIAPILQARLQAQHNKKLHFDASVKLLKNEARLKEAEKLAKIGHWEHDILKNTLSWSDEVYRIFGLDSREFTPSIEGFLHVVHPDDQERVKHSYLNALENKTTYETTHRLLHADGTIKYVHERCAITYNAYDKAIRSLGTVQDISSRVQAEKSNKRLVTAIDQVIDAIVITDPKGIIQYVNPAFEKLTGYSRQEALGLNPRVLKSGKHSSAFYGKLWDTICSGNVWHGKLTNKNKNGELFTEVATITPVKDETGQIINFVAVKHDITRELELEQQLRHAVKMESIGTLAGGIAHDFNNILAAMLGYTRMAMEELPQESQTYEDLSHVIQSGNRATDLIRQILLFSRHQEQGFVPVQVQFVIKEALKMLRASLPATIVLEKKIEHDCPAIMADPTQIHQVIMNLSTNAKQAMLSKGGTLSITLSQRNIGDEKQERLPGLNPGNYVQLVVKDTGTGISKEDLTRIFDPFFSTKVKGEGTGLGLAVAHGIIKSHHGVISVDSELERGTTFTIFLPVAKEINSPEKEKTDARLPEGEGHLLVVDDERDILILRERVLTKLGYQVTTFSSSLDALASFQENPLQYDLLLTDMTMPDMDGKTLTENLIALRPNLPVILCTGHSELIDKEQALECGIGAFLRKPIAPQILAETIREILT